MASKNRSLIVGVLATMTVSAAVAVEVVPGRIHRVDRYTLTDDKRAALERLGHPEFVELLTLASYPNVWQIADLATMAWKEADALGLGQTVQGKELLALRDNGLRLTTLAAQHPAELKDLTALKQEQLLLFRLAEGAAGRNPDDTADLQRLSRVTQGPLARAGLQAIERMGAVDASLQRASSNPSVDHNFQTTLVILHSSTPRDAVVNMRLAGLQSADERKSAIWAQHLREMTDFAAAGGGERNRDLNKVVALLKLPNIDDLAGLLSLARAQMVDDTAGLAALDGLALKLNKLRADEASLQPFRLVQSAREASIFQGAQAARATAEGDKAFAAFKRQAMDVARSPATPAMLSLFEDYTAFVNRQKGAGERGDFGAHCAAEVLGSMTLAQANVALSEAFGSPDMALPVPSLFGAVDVARLADGRGRLNAAAVVALSSWPQVVNWKRQSRMAQVGFQPGTMPISFAFDIVRIGLIASTLNQKAEHWLSNLHARRDEVASLQQRAAAGQEEAKADLARIAAQGDEALDAGSKSAVADFWKVWTPFIRYIAARTAYGDGNATFFYAILDAPSLESARYAYENSPRHLVIRASNTSRQARLLETQRGCAFGRSEYTPRTASEREQEIRCIRELTDDRQHELQACRRDEDMQRRKDPDYLEYADHCGI